MSKEMQTGPNYASAGNENTDTSSVRRISSQALMAGGSRLWIEHDGVHYQLQVTRQGKLILTK